MIKNTELEEQHIIQKSFPLSKELLAYLAEENWVKVDEYFLKAGSPGGELFLFLQEFLVFSSIEHIISIRSAPLDEDGIWHDDGSRILGFTLSLTANPESIIGGHLLFKSKNEASHLSLSTRPIGEMLLFKTGIYGFEHMVTAVTQGKRVLIAGWCS